jgi:catechol 2,3-dioxygenase-like lactoylglutathione lyase family enzyme
MVRILSPHDEGGPMLADGQVATRLPAQDLERARAFYAEKLGLEPVDERPGGLLYRCSGTEFALYQSTGSSPGTFTQMGWEVDDVEATVAELRERGVQFYEDSLVEIEGNYPSKNSYGERANWFWDSEGNLIGVGQPLR